MRKLTLTLLIILLISCRSKVNELHTQKGSVSKAETAAELFINDYVNFCNQQFENKALSKSDWIEQSELLSTGFKERYKSILDSAKKEDPELGYGSDPIFDAQDYPESGFSVKSIDTVNGLIIVEAKDKNQFEGGFPLVISTVLQDGKLFVDGAGVINVPENKRAKGNFLLIFEPS